MTFQEKILKSITGRSIECQGCKETIVKEIVKATEEMLPEERDYGNGMKWSQAEVDSWNACLQEIKRRLKSR